MIQIRDKEYELKFTINMLCEMSEQGFDVMNIGAMNINIRTIRDLFYYALKGADKKITKAKAGDLMDAFIEEGGSFDELIDVVMEALGKSLGNKPVEDEEDKEDGEREEEEGLQ